MPVESLMEKMWSELSEVPSVFTLNLPVPEYAISINRMKYVKATLESEIKSLENISDKYTEDKEELVQALDLLTWLEYKIGSEQKALELNDRALALTNKEAVFTLGNRAHLMWCLGEFQETKCCLHNLARLKEKQPSVVKASQAYCLFRLGGCDNLSSAITLFEEALSINKNSYLWMLQAGMCYSRLTHPNMRKKNTRIDFDVKRNRENRAKEYFQRVANKSSNPKLKAFAYSDLAKLARRSEDVREFCEKAISINGHDPYILLNCGKSLRKIDLSKAMHLLEEANTQGPNSSILSQLGNCFCDMAIKHRNDAKLRAYYNDRAQECFHNAIHLSPLNMPARYSLASLLYQIGKLEQARLQFGKLISALISAPFESHSYTLMKAYEQAGRCQLELCKDENYVANLPDPVTELSLRKDAEIMLIKALEIGFCLCTAKEIKKHLKFSVGVLKEGSRSFEDTNDTPKALQLYFSLHHLVNGSESTLEALDRFLKHQSDDRNAIIIALKSYLELEAYDLAYALLQTSSARLEPFAIDENLRRKVALSAARNLLLQCSAEAARIFKAYFDHHRLHNHCQERKNLSEDQLQPTETDVSADVERLDVLILFDDSHDGAKGESHLSSYCRKLQQAMSTVFGLNVSHNMQTSCAGGPVTALQLAEAARAQLVLVVIGTEPINEYFQSLLDFLPRLTEHTDANSTPPRMLVALTEEGVTLPTPISELPKVPRIESLTACLDAYMESCASDQDEAGAPGGDSKDVDENVKIRVEDSMTFFCCLISTSWPLPSENEASSSE